MGFFKKLFKPVAKVFDKIIPNELKPALPYLAAFAPMMMPASFGIGSLGPMMSRGLMSGGLNIGAQLAQEGNEGDINALSALMAGGIGALSAPGSSGGRTIPGTDASYSQYMGGDKLASTGTQSAGNYLRGISNSGGIGDKALNFLGQGADKLSSINAAGRANPFSMAGLKAASIPFAQGTGDLMKAEGDRALKDYERALLDYENSLEEGQFATDSGRRAAIIAAMTAGQHTQQVIDDTLAELGLQNGGIVSLQNGGRVNFRGGGMDASETEFGEEYVIIEGDNGPIRIKKSDYESMSGMFMDTTTSLYGDAARGRPVPDFSEKKNEPDFGGIEEAVENIDIEEKKDRFEDIKDLRTDYEPGVPSGGDLFDMNNPDYKGINKKIIREFIEEGIPLGYKSPEEYFDDFYGPFAKKNKNTITAKDGGMMSILPQGMEMDYRQGGFIPIGSEERADDVKARVSKNEFVMTADAVRAAGGGNINEGAKKMYEIMNNLEARA